MKRIERVSNRLNERYTLIEHSSGLAIYVFPKPLTSTHVIFSVRYGSLDSCFRSEGEEEWITVPDGVAHFLEHKMFENADGSDSFEHFSACGADANAYTTCDRTAYLFSCTDQWQEPLRELLKFVREPHFTSANVKKEQGIIAEEIRMCDDNPWERCFQNLMEGLYLRHPVRTNICGTEESIARITPELLYACHSAFYRLPNMALVVCGDVTAEEVLEVADACLPAEREHFAVERAACDEPEEAHLPRMQSRMQVSKPIFSIGIKDADVPKSSEERLRRDAAMTLLEEILFSRSAEFFSTLFEEGLLTSSYSFGYSITRDIAFHSVSGESDRPEEVLQRLQSYLARMAERGIDAEEFERCRRVLYADEIRSYDNTEEIANNLLVMAFDGAELFNYPAVLEGLTVEELNQLLKTMLKPSAFCLSTVDPLEEQGAEQERSK